MNLKEENDTRNAYSAVYECRENRLKIVAVYLDLNAKAFLEIQNTGLELKISCLEFRHGKATSHSVTGRHGRQTQTLEDNPEELEMILTKYANEFIDIVMDNEKIRRYLKSHFTQLQDYIAKNVAFSMISTKRMNLPPLPPELPEKQK